MKKRYIYFSILFIYTSAFSQKSSTILYLFLDKPQYKYSCEKNLGYDFAISSQDKRFLMNYYKFDIYNIKGFSTNTKYDYDYYTLDEIQKEISIDTIKYKTIKEFTENKTPWEIHNELSLMKKIFFIKKIKSNFKYKYYAIPAIYEGTRKNVIPTDLSKHK